MQVIIHGREGVLFEGAAHALSASNERGAFDLLPMHSRFVSTFTGELTLHLSGGRQQKFTLQSGVIRLDQNQAEVFVGI